MGKVYTFTFKEAVLVSATGVVLFQTAYYALTRGFAGVPPIAAAIIMGVIWLFYAGAMWLSFLLYTGWRQRAK